MALSSDFILSVFNSPEKRERFWAKVERQEDKNVCWPWTGAIAGNGYANTRVGDKFAQAHRVGFALEFGDCPEDLQLLHGCDYRRCCNPYHLTPGTGSANMQDAVAKGRHHGGAKRKLTPETELLIFRRYREDNDPVPLLADEFDIGPTTVRHIIKRVEAAYACAA